MIATASLIRRDSHLLALAAALTLGLALFFVGSSDTHAKDLSLQYQHYEGFQCFHRNRLNECTDFSYFDTGTYRPTSLYRPTVQTTQYYYRDSYQDTYRYQDVYRPTTVDGDVSISVTADDDDVDVGDTINYRIVVRNNDSFTRRVDVNAFFDDDLASFDSASGGGREVDDDEVEWSLSLPARASRTLTLRLEVENNADDGDEIRLRVEAGDESDEVDVEVRDDRRSNNDDDDDCDRNDDCDVSVRLSTSDDEAEPGELVTFTVILENDSDRDRIVDVRSLFDEDDWRFFSASDGGALRGSDDRIDWNDILVREDNRRILSFSLRVDSRADDGDEFKVEVETPDDSDDVTIEVQD